MSTAQDPSSNCGPHGVFCSLRLGVFHLRWVWESGALFGSRNHGAFGFCACTLAVLSAHELAHYWVAKRHGFALSLPYFIPFPFAFGTLGAVIRLKSFPKTRTGLLEMGAAGPIAGALVAFACLFFGLLGTEVVEAPPLSDEGVEILIFGNPPVMDVFGVLLERPGPIRCSYAPCFGGLGWVLSHSSESIASRPIGWGAYRQCVGPKVGTMDFQAVLVGLLIAGYFLWEVGRLGGSSPWNGGLGELEVPPQPGLTVHRCGMRGSGGDASLFHANAH